MPPLQSISCNPRFARHQFITVSKTEMMMPQHATASVWRSKPQKNPVMHSYMPNQRIAVYTHAVYVTVASSMTSNDVSPRKDTMKASTPVVACHAMMITAIAPGYPGNVWNIPDMAMTMKTGHNGAVMLLMIQ